jgi:two-component system, response regulator
VRSNFPYKLWLQQSKNRGIYLDTAIEVVFSLLNQPYRRHRQFRSAIITKMSRKTILLVEENTDYQQLLSLAFEKSNSIHNLTIVRDGVEALDYLFNRGRFDRLERDIMPALMILDLHLPKLDGLEVLQRLRSESRTRLLPVVIMSASKDPQDIINSYSFGCNSYIRKPVDFRQLQTIIDRLSLYWLTLNEMPPTLGIS